MNNQPFTRLSSEQKFKCPYYYIQHDEYSLPNGKIGEYFIVKRPKAAMVVPRLADGKFLLVKQYRYVFQDWFIEFPAGTGELGEDFIEIAARELSEECGVTAGRLTEIHQLAPYNGIADEVCCVYYADQLEPNNAQPDEDELIEVLKLSELEIDELIKNNKIQDSTTIAAWCLWRNKIKQ